MELEKVQIQKAVNALNEYLKTKDNDTNLLKDLESFSLLISLNYIPDKTYSPQFIDLPHPIYNEDASICIITKTISKEETDSLTNMKISGVNEIVSIDDLKQKYKTFEAKRNLCQTHDLFLADDKVLPLLPSYLGKTFFKNRKLPAPIRINSNLKFQVEKGLKKCSVYLPTGNLLQLKIGTEKLTASQLVENIETAIRSVTKYFSNNMDSVQSISVKVADSPGLPIYGKIQNAFDLEEAKKESSNEAVGSSEEEETTETQTKEEIKKEVTKEAKKETKKVVKEDAKEEIKEQVKAKSNNGIKAGNGKKITQKKPSTEQVGKQTRKKSKKGE
ncbi:ribosomal protein L1 [Neoconidiobolus thromboides FSU 785]|nr:ribosomal protein L1 [Neoconidiobolus thromboides FSU 785]